MKLPDFFLIRGRFPLLLQRDSMDCGVACIAMTTAFYGKKYSLQSIRDNAFVTREGVSLLAISTASEKLGFRTRGIKTTARDLALQAPLPCILFWKQNHYVILYDVKFRRNKPVFYIADPAMGRIALDEKSFQLAWLCASEKESELGVALLLEPGEDFYSTAQCLPDQSLSIKFVIKYLSPYKKLIAQLFIGLLTASLLQLIFPFLTQSIVDVGINLHNISFIYLILIGQLFFTFSRLTVEFIRRWILVHISARINIAILSDFLIKLMKLPIRFFDTKMVGDLLQRIADHEKIQNFLTSSTLSILFSAVNLLIFGVVFYIYSKLIFLVFLAGSVLYVLWIVLFLKKRRDIDYKKFIHLSDNQSNLQQLIYGIQEIKLNNCETQKRSEWEKIQAKVFKTAIGGLKIEQIQIVGATVINEVKNIFITFLTAKAVIDGNLTFGGMLAIQYINGQLNGPIASLIDFAFSFQDAKLALDRLQEIHSKPDEEQILNNKLISLPNDKTINIKNLTFRYNDPYAKPALNNLTMTIPNGKTTAIVGTSGSGKTTLIKLLLGFYEPETGSIQIGGNSFDELNIRMWRDNCGAVMQDGYIFNDTIAKNIAVGSEEVDMDNLIYSSQVANLSEFVSSLPLKFNTKIGGEGMGLSQGQKQRILIARIVYKNPFYIFFDEATNALDAKNERTIVQQLNNFFQNKTVLVVAHRLSTVRNADQIIVLENGELVEQGSHNELILNKGYYYNLIKDQLELECHV